MGESVKGQIRCSGCPGRIELGYDELDRLVTWPTTLQTVIRREGRWLILECGHRVSVHPFLLSSDEWCEINGEIRRGEGLIFGKPLPGSVV